MSTEEEIMHFGDSWKRDETLKGSSIGRCLGVTGIVCLERIVDPLAFHFSFILLLDFMVASLFCYPQILL